MTALRKIETLKLILRLEEETREYYLKEAISLACFASSSWGEKVTNSKFTFSTPRGNLPLKGTCNWEWVSKLETYRATFLWRSSLYGLWVTQLEEKHYVITLYPHIWSNLCILRDLRWWHRKCEENIHWNFMYLFILLFSARDHSLY